MGVYIIGVYLTSVYLIGMHLMVLGGQSRANHRGIIKLGHQI
jgi:hypothetical protein